jgi:tetratricopeptide (TPR) repeat protein
MSEENHSDNPVSPAESTDSDGVGKQLTALVHEVVEARNQTIKTANAVGNLTAQVRAVGKEREQQRRTLTINSVAAYLIFTVIIAAGFFFAFRSRMDRAAFERDALLREKAGLATELQSIRKQAEQRRRSEEKAAGFYQLIRGQQVEKALKQYQEIADLPLTKAESAFFGDWVTRSRNSLAYAAHAAAMRAVAGQKWKIAVREFQSSLKLVPEPAYAASLYYYTGIAQMKLGSYPEAIQSLQQALNAKAEKLVTTQVRYHMAAIFELMGQRDKAIATYRDYFRRHPHGSHRKLARRRYRALREASK